VPINHIKCVPNACILVRNDFRDRGSSDHIPEALKELDARLERQLKASSWKPTSASNGDGIDEARPRPLRMPVRSRIDELKERVSRRGEHLHEDSEPERPHRWEDGATCLSEGEDTSRIG
jgi:hypothetical protein